MVPVFSCYICIKILALKDCVGYCVASSKQIVARRGSYLLPADRCNRADVGIRPYAKILQIKNADYCRRIC